MSLNAGFYEYPKLDYLELQEKEAQMPRNAFFRFLKMDVLKKQLLPAAGQKLLYAIQTRGMAISEATYTLGLSDNAVTNSTYLGRIMRNNLALQASPELMRDIHHTFLGTMSIDKFIYGTEIPMEVFPIDFYLIHAIKALPNEARDAIKQELQEKRQEVFSVEQRLQEYGAQANRANLWGKYAPLTQTVWYRSSETRQSMDRLVNWCLFSIISGISLDYLFDDYQDAQVYYFDQSGKRQLVAKRDIGIVSMLPLADKIATLNELSRRYPEAREAMRIPFGSRQKRLLGNDSPLEAWDAESSQEGREKGRLMVFRALVQQKTLTIEEAARAANMSLAEFLTKTGLKLE